MARKRRGRSEGAVYQRGDGTWTASLSLGYGEDGKRRRKTVYGTSKREVLQKLEDLRQKVRGGQPLDVEKLTVRAFLESWLVNAKKPAVSDTTFDRYEQHVRLSLVPVIGELLLGKLTKYHVEQLYAELEKRGISRAEQQKAGKALRNALKHAVANDLVAKGSRKNNLSNSEDVSMTG